MMKKFLAVAAIVSLAACSGGNQSEAENTEMDGATSEMTEGMESTDAATEATEEASHDASMSEEPAATTEASHSTTSTEAPAQSETVEKQINDQVEALEKGGAQSMEAVETPRESRLNDDQNVKK